MKLWYRCKRIADLNKRDYRNGPSSTSSALGMEEKCRALRTARRQHNKKSALLACIWRNAQKTLF